MKKRRSYLPKVGDRGGKFDLFIFNSAQNKITCKEAKEQINSIDLKPSLLEFSSPFKYFKEK